MSDFPDEIEVLETSYDDQGNSAEVAIEVDGKPYRFWENVEITRSFDSIADTFSLSAPWFPDNMELRAAFKPFSYKDCAVYVAGEKILTGILLNIKPDTKPNSRRITVSGYSYPGIIADVPADHSAWPISMNGLDLEEIAKRLCEPYNLKVIFEAAPGAKFSKSEKTVLKPDERIGNFLIKLAKQRGLIISSSRTGELIFRKPTTDPPVAFIQEGKFPHNGSGTEYNGQKRYSTVTAIGTNNKKGAGQKYTVEDPGLKNIPIKRPMIFKAQDIPAGGLKEAATAKLGRLIAESVNINIPIVGWHTPDGKLFSDNQMITYQSDGDMIYEETEFLIRNCKYGKQQNSKTCGLSLVFPEAYNGKVRESFPWD